jgi:shikimate kinase
MYKSGIVLIGMPGSGKSTIGKMLADELGYQFTDLDVYIREKEGRTPQEIINQEGENTMMNIEKRRMYEIDLIRRVVAPGGSLVYHDDLMQYLKLKAAIIYLNESLANLEKRLYNASTRGIIGLKDSSLKTIFAEREPLYQRYADITINSDVLSRLQITRTIVEKLKDPHIQALNF